MYFQFVVEMPSHLIPALIAYGVNYDLDILEKEVAVVFMIMIIVHNINY